MREANRFSKVNLEENCSFLKHSYARTNERDCLFTFRLPRTNKEFKINLLSPAWGKEKITVLDENSNPRPPYDQSDFLSLSYKELVAS